MHRSSDFSSAVRRGERARARTLVLHLDRHAHHEVPVAGLVVSRAVGGSVVRHAVSRRLRAQLADRLSALPDGSAVVVRALPSSATASSRELGRDLDTALARLGATR